MSWGHNYNRSGIVIILKVLVELVMIVVIIVLVVLKSLIDSNSRSFQVSSKIKLNLTTACRLDG